eukprot:scaffold64098_cov53-Attheya_sp.AAC.1
MTNPMPHACASSNSISVPLCMPHDSMYLNDIHCFVRRNVEAFVATRQDILAPCPGRKKKDRLTVGQVGIRCIHCAKLPLGERVKRSVCYPPSISGIYHSVSNIKFDHFDKCRGLPAHERETFTTLRQKCTQRRHRPSSPLIGGAKLSNSTAQYYQDSAVALKLVDTPEGIRFSMQVSPKQDPPTTFRVFDGMSALMIAATNPQLRAEFEKRRQPTISM